MLTEVRTRVGDGLYRRDAHAKSQGCLLGTFTVKKGLDPDIAQGILLAESLLPEGLSLTAHGSRFSSGNQDLQIRLAARRARDGNQGIESSRTEVALEGEEKSRRYFRISLMINNPAFFIPNVKEYAAFTSFQAAGSRQFGYFFDPKWKPVWNGSCANFALAPTF